MCSLNNAYPNKKLAQVFVDKLEVQEIEERATYYGRIIPENIYKIYSPLEGLVTKIKAPQGSFVQKGQTLAILKKNVMGMEIRPLVLRSPIKGFVLEVKHSEHSLIPKNQHIFSVYDGKNYKIPLHLAPDDALKIKRGDSVTILIGEQKIQGRVATLSQNIDPASGTRKAKIQLSPSRKIRPGQLAKVFFHLNKHKGILIPKKILLKKGHQYFLNLVENDKVNQVKVDVKKRQKDQFEILGNKIKPKQTFITKSSQSPLVHGQVVEIQKKKGL